MATAILDHPVPPLRVVAFCEGVSFLVLLGIAMPLKYAYDSPSAVKVCGWIHGVLFVLVCALLAATARVGWSRRQQATVFVAALLPFGTFVVDPAMRRWSAARRATP